MEILVLGGTGAMGEPLCKLLAKQGHIVTCTSRSPRISNNPNLKYLQGNAKEVQFIEKITNEKWDAIVDFMVYSTDEFKEIYHKYLEATTQYVFISSARVYAQIAQGELIKETSPRLLDICKDEEYLKTDEYALAKARQEDILEKSGQKNYTIIRPSITYNKNRLQLGGFEKEEWLYRALKSRSIVLSKDIIDKTTTMTFGEDVAKGICSIIGNKSTLGEAFHLTEKNSYKWREILEVYLDVLEKHIGKRPKVKITKKSILLKFRYYQMFYCKLYDRSFDCSKIQKYVEISNFITAKEGLRKCLEEFLADIEFKEINIKLEAKNDISAKELMSFSELTSKKDKIYYMIYRLRLEKVFTYAFKLYSRLKTNNK